MLTLARVVDKGSGLRGNLEGGGKILLVKPLAVFLAGPVVQDNENIQASQRDRGEAQRLRVQLVQGTQRIQRPQGTQKLLENLEGVARLKGKKARFAIPQGMVN